MTDTPEDIDEDKDAARIAEMQTLLVDIKEEHRRIDQEIKALEELGVVDVLKIRRMKKVKLAIKDQITYLENQVTPDIIA